ncbi:MAG: hypothetical protein O7B99_03260 [Planctomycetota bacterium]|nr:hypothetical protein [Planctomycetota bacterium]
MGNRIRLSEPRDAGDWIPRADRRAPQRPVCLLTTPSSDRGLSKALVQHLAEEVPEIAFQLDPGPRPEAIDAVWVCGYRPGFAGHVRDLHDRHPAAVMVVTGREPTEDWEEEVRAAGADWAFSWPIAWDVLESLLCGTAPRALRCPPGLA